MKENFKPISNEETDKLVKLAELTGKLGYDNEDEKYKTETDEALVPKNKEERPDESKETPKEKSPWAKDKVLEEDLKRAKNILENGKHSPESN